MRIGELADRTGVSVRALRYYEEQHLLTAERSPSGQRHYPDGAVERVQLIQRLYTAGLSSRTIVELLPCVVDGNATPALLDRLAAERDSIDRRIAELADTRDRLHSVINGATANMLTGRPCPAADTSRPGDERA
ncbi:Redox-sensitive transcriptional activator SoxR [Actinomadura rubteroloni]|uniref:Redox-sensitive transcriptional activator SoxR n=1 Tax=Actinomadura rubteroloni TaxID=1926885 RepID=A0A2P4UES2_9ACTN|nr:MerR family transcriptional regulator [Actinomadura rubteroloni]POM23539.1 Redox-sensitive transcriptional activator SoxR [Actinomadura rubteroloni]